jgi:hypothetical protein
MADEYIVDRESTYEHFLSVLQRSSQVDLNEFDRVSRKTLAQDFDEVKRGASKLRYNPVTGWIDRFSSNVKIRFVLDILRQTYLREVARGSPRSGGLVEFWDVPRDYAVRETIELDENGVPEEPIDAAVRALQQEGRKLWERIGYLPTEKDLHPWQIPTKPDRYPSTAFMGHQSRVTTTGYDLYFGLIIGEDRASRETGIILRDTDGKPETATNWVDIYLEPGTIDSRQWEDIYKESSLSKRSLVKK